MWLLNTSVTGVDCGAESGSAGTRAAPPTAVLEEAKKEILKYLLEDTNCSLAVMLACIAPEGRAPLPFASSPFETCFIKSKRYN